MLPVTCEEIDVIFDVENTEEDDYDDTWILYEIFQKTVGA